VGSWNSKNWRGISTRALQNFYNAVFDPEKLVLRSENAVFWNDLPLKTKV